MNDSTPTKAHSIVPMTVIGTLAQLTMICAGHYSAFIRESVFAIGGMLISLVFGAGWAAMGATGKSRGARGGALVGGIGAIIGIAVSIAIGDTPAIVLSFGTASSAVTGAFGGLLGYVLFASKRHPRATA